MPQRSLPKRTSELPLPSLKVGLGAVQAPPLRGLPPHKAPVGLCWGSPARDTQRGLLHRQHRGGAGEVRRSGQHEAAGGRWGKVNALGGVRATGRGKAGRSLHRRPDAAAANGAAESLENSLWSKGLLGLSRRQALPGADNRRGCMQPCLSRKPAACMPRTYPPQLLLGTRCWPTLPRGAGERGRGPLLQGIRPRGSHGAARALKQPPHFCQREPSTLRRSGADMLRW